jgi:hypothetical protein
VIAALLAASLAAAPAAGCGMPPLAPGARPWRSGESLTYDLEMLGMVQAGTMQLAVERPISAGKVIPLRARARSTRSAASLKPFAAIGLSWIDAATLRPERYREESQEDGVHKSADFRLAPPGPEIVVEFHGPGEAGKRAAVPRERDALDAVSMLYNLRAARLAPGDRICIDLVVIGRAWRVTATVAPKTERVETPAGKFETVRVDAEARRADRPDAKPRAVHVWVGTDARRLPVAMVGEAEFGPVSATLSAIH